MARTGSELGRVKQEIEALGRRSWILRADLEDVEEARQAVRLAIGAMGRVDVLVNCAGGGLPSGVSPG